MSKKIIQFFRALFQAVIEIIFPEHCIGCEKYNTLLCAKCYEKIEFQSEAKKSNLKDLKFVDNVYVASKYGELTRKIIYDCKYKGVINIGKIIAKIIFRTCEFEEYDLVIPVPIHQDKKKKRGFNQSEVMAREFSKLTAIPYSNLLIKTKNTASQMSIKDREKRKNNLKDSFKINLRELQKLSNRAGEFFPKKIIIVDDVVTTGSTFDQSAKVLRESGFLAKNAQIDGLAFTSR